METRYQIRHRITGQCIGKTYATAGYAKTALIKMSEKRIGCKSKYMICLTTKRL